MAKNMRKPGSTSLGVVLLFLLAATSSGTAACSRVPRIEIDRPEARLSPVLLGVCSIFMKIENFGNGDDTLLGARVDIPGTITELHDVKDGKMVKRGEISIPANSVVDLRPGSMHIMVLRMPVDMKEGQEFTVLLNFEKSGEKRVAVTLAKASRS